MTTPADQDAIDSRLMQSFAAADDDPRWAGDSWSDPMGRVRRARRRHDRRVATVCALATAGLLAGGVAGVSALSSAQDRVRVVGPTGQDATGTGLDWLLTPSQYGAYTAAHPSPSPAVDRVPSPAPADNELQRLQADVAAALPSGVQTIRADAADGGVRGAATVWLRLDDGTPVAVERSRLTYPRALTTDTASGTTASGTTGAVAPERFTDPETWPDGTAYTVITGSGWGYGFDRATQWSGPFVWTATGDGWLTMWTAPVPTQRLLDWAQAADAHFVSTG